MEQFLKIAWEYRFIIILVLAFLLVFLFERQRAITILYALMLQAKRMAKDMVLNSGQEQEEWVVQKAKIYLPKEILVFLPDERLKAFVKFLFAKLKDYADDGQLNDSYKSSDADASL
jgi:hypothetical protein